MRENNILDIYRERPEFLLNKTRSRGVSVVASSFSSSSFSKSPATNAGCDIFAYIYEASGR